MLISKVQTPERKVSVLHKGIPEEPNQVDNESLGEGLADGIDA